MSTPPNDGFLPRSEPRESYGPGEDTLRLIATLPAPDGLPERVQAGLRAAPQAGRILLWRGPLRPPGGWMYSSVLRGAAAAAIVCVVAGGGWRIYSHVLPIPANPVVLAPVPVTPGGSGFSQAGAKRVPETLDGPVLKHPVAPASDVNVVDKAPAVSPARAARAPAKKKKAPSRTAVIPLQ